MKRKRVAPYRVWALDAEERRTPLSVHGIVVELRSGIEVELDFAPHPTFAGELTLLTPPASRMAAEYDSGNVDDFAVVFGATNALHVIVDRRRRQKAKAAKKASSRARVRAKRA